MTLTCRIPNPVLVVLRADDFDEQMRIHDVLNEAGQDRICVLSINGSVFKLMMSVQEYPRWSKELGVYCASSS